MLTDKLLAEILIRNQFLSEKDLHNARERQKNAESETLEESLLFLGLADYAMLGKAYVLHYQLPYYPVFHQGIDSNAIEQFPTKIVQYLLCLPIGGNQKEHFTIVSCQPESKLRKRKITQLSGGVDVDWRVASRVEINDAISRYYLKQSVKREKQEIELPFDFKIIDSGIGGELDKTDQGSGAGNSTLGQSRPKGKRIILIEPDIRIRQAITTLLSHEGYRVAEVIDEDEAIKELSQEDAVYLLKRRVFHSQTRNLESFITEYKRQVEIRYFGNLGGFLLGEELSPEELFRNYLATVKLLLSALTMDNREIIKICRLTARYARLMATSLGLKRKTQEALLLAVYLKEIGRYDDHAEEGEENNIRSLIPVLPYEKSAATLKEIEDSFGLSEIIAQINQPAAQAPLEAKIITLLLWFINGPGTNDLKDITTVQFHLQLNKEPEGLIDYQLAEELLQIISHEQHLAGLTKSSGTILVIDPSFERDQGDLYDRLIKESYEVSFALTIDQALTRLEQQPTILIISEIGHENYDGITFCETIKGQSQTLPFVFFTSENRDELIAEALLAGADDFIAKESSTHIAFLKLNRLIRQSYRQDNSTTTSGVSGSLEEMGFMETIQILANREKDALITLQNQDNNSAEVYLHLGEITHADCGKLKGETAIYELLTWKNGFFQVKTPEQLPERNVFDSTEAIMLEGCRLMDEELRDLREVANDERPVMSDE